MIVYIFAFLLLLQIPFTCHETTELLASYPLMDSGQKLHKNKSGAENIVFASTDGGQTWQDISEGLPGNVQDDAFFANENGLYLHAGNGIYHSKPNANPPFWKKEMFPDGQSSITPAKTGILAYNYGDVQFLQIINRTSLGLPIYTHLQQKQVHMVLETARGTVFIRSDKGLFKSANGGKTWKQVHTGGWIMQLVESNRVLLATSQKGILRSTDEGENWHLVISEGGVGIAVACIKGGFAAITYNTASETRRVRASYDGGKTWQAIDSGLPASHLIASIIEVDGYFFCGHPSGIFRSADKGKTWKLLLPSIENKVFLLSCSGKVIYAIPRNKGC